MTHSDSALPNRHSHRLLQLLCCLLAGVMSGSREFEAQADDGAELYETRIRPVLMDSCYRCHSGEIEEPAGGLRLDTVEGMLHGGHLGPAVVAGDPDESLLYKAVCYDGLEMPPAEQLSDDVVADIRKWIEMGAPCGASSPSESASKVSETSATEKSPEDTMNCVLCSDSSSLLPFPVSGIGNWPSFIAGYLLLPQD